MHTTKRTQLHTHKRTFYNNTIIYIYMRKTIVRPLQEHTLKAVEKIDDLEKNLKKKNCNWLPLWYKTTVKTNVNVRIR